MNSKYSWCTKTLKAIKPNAKVENGGEMEELLIHKPKALYTPEK